MAKIFRHSSKKVGLPPGALVYVGKKHTHPLDINCFEYSAQHCEEYKASSIDGIRHNDDSFHWIDLIGVHHVEVVEQLCARFNVHPLTIEDIINTDQRPKMEEGEGYVYVVLKMLDYDKNAGGITGEQISLLMGANFVITFQERPGDTFQGVRNRLTSGKGRIRKSGPGYLMYALVDGIIDNYYTVLEKMGERLENSEEALLKSQNNQSLHELYHLKRELLLVRRAAWPAREVLARLQRDDLPLIQAEHKVYYRDVYDHTIQVIDTVETYRDLVAGMVDLYQSMQSNRMNAIMKVLTIISTIFIPLTFIAGVYGMNFEYMPELDTEYGYFFSLAAMAAIAITMVFWFRRKKWL